MQVKGQIPFGGSTFFDSEYSQHYTILDRIYCSRDISFNLRNSSAINHRKRDRVCSVITQWLLIH